MEENEKEQRTKIMNRDQKLRLERQNTIKESMVMDQIGNTTEENTREDIPKESSHRERVVMTEETTACDEIFAFKSLLPMGQREVDQCDEPMVCKAVADPDTM